MVSAQLEAGRRDTSLDGWRGVAILGVLFDHFVTSHVLNLGRFGVEMFFVLSGMLMADILFVRRTPVGTFFARRFARIYPAMAVFATLVFLFAVATGLADVPAQAYASVLTLTANYVSVFWRRTYDYDHIWSLCIEQHTYFCLGAIAALSRWRVGRPAVLTACLAGLAILDGAVFTWGFGWKYNAVYWRTDVRGASILIGAVAFMLVREPPASLRRWLASPWTSPVLAAAALALNVNLVPDPVKYSLGTVVVAICAACLSRAPAWFRGVFESRALVAVGAASYSIYLWQEPFNEVDDPSLRLKLLPLALLCGVVSYRCVETPARRALNRLTHSRPTLAPEPRIAG